jgi:sirohydrochlorin ferrochelatase
VLIMHGATPKDFPPALRKEHHSLRARCEAVPSPATVDERLRFEALDRELRRWPRTRANDPFYFAARRIARHLTRAARLPVFLGFNEFCAPSAVDALDAAVLAGAGQVLVTTLMLTRGGHHSEEEIPELISEARQRHPQTRFIYAWPFKEKAITQFLCDNIRPFYV